MDIYISLVVILTASIQSLFGVGVLLFGTPLLLLLDYPFLEALLILLPASASINLLQIIKDYRYINMYIYKKVLLITVPFVIIFLFLVSKTTINVSIIIGLFLVFIALKDYVELFRIMLNKYLSFDKIFYITMGVVHGLTNLGGALLTAKVFSIQLGKHEKRATVAISYLTFALFQITTILILKNTYHIKYIIYIGVGILTFIITNKFFFQKITNHKYDKLFSLFLILSGTTLILKGIAW